MKTLFLLFPLAAFAAKPAKPTAKIEAPARPLSFRLDVMPVFFRAGCNSGGCHGAASGKDGFRLSLFGYDPAGDYFRLTQQMVGRRVNLGDPEQSLVLLKAVGKVPHSGGRRFKPDSDYYKTLLAWLKQGAQDDSASVPEVTGIAIEPANFLFAGKQKTQPAKVIAKYSDGTSRDVTNLALYMTNNKTVGDLADDGILTAGSRGATYVFARFAKYTVGAEVIVLPAEKFKWPAAIKPANYIDEAVYAKLKKLYITPSEPCTDDEFLRRVSLDLIGIPPAVGEYRQFAADKSANKRAKAIDALLERDEFNDLWAAKWSEALKIIGEQQSQFGTDRKAALLYYNWIRDQVKRNTPLDEFVRVQVASRGSNFTDPAVNLYTMLPQGNYQAKAMAQDVAQLFTGIRIQCSECHNHPFDRWTMEDYYGFVSFFTGVKRKQASETREFYVYGDAAPPAKHLLDNRPVPAKFLGASAPIDATAKDPRQVLAKWLTSPDNELFRQNMANRVWANFFGRGIVDPVDDVRISNPPSNRELLQAIGKKLADYNYDAKKLMRDICNSRTYQASARTNESNKADEAQFSHARLRRLRADVLLDSISLVTESDTQFNAYPNGSRAVQVFDGGRRYGSYFLRAFGLAERTSVDLSESRMEPTLSQTLHLINGDTVEGKIAKSPVIDRMLKESKPPKEIIEDLYIRALTRRPSGNELDKMMTLQAKAPAAEAKKTYGDIFWALLNSTEFVFNH